MKKGDLPTRLAFELDHRPVDGSYTAHAGVPLLIEAFRTSGAGMVLDEKVVIKQRRRGLYPSQMAEGLFALWASGGERCKDLARLREDGALGVLIGHSLPAPQTARDFLDAFDEALPPLWQGDHGAPCPPRAKGCRVFMPPAGGSSPFCSSVLPKPPPRSTSMRPSSPARSARRAQPIRG